MKLFPLINNYINETQGIKIITETIIEEAENCDQASQNQLPDWSQFGGLLREGKEKGRGFRSRRMRQPGCWIFFIFRKHFRFKALVVVIFGTSKSCS